jgi:phosphoenolpyruvate carboxylase
VLAQSASLGTAQVTLDMVEMVFAKADPRVSLLYEEHLCAPELHSFGDEVRR